MIAAQRSDSQYRTNPFGYPGPTTSNKIAPPQDLRIFRKFVYMFRKSFLQKESDVSPKTWFSLHYHYGILFPEWFL